MKRQITIPLTLINLQDDGFHLLVEIVVFNKKSEWAVLDTGASRTVFDKNYLMEYLPQLADEEESHATTLFSTSSTIQALIPRLKIGTLKVIEYHAVALDLETVNAAYTEMGHPKIVAILGSDLLLKYQAKIDYKKQKMFLSRSEVSK
jgi:hypothetical protein